jgi:hypothetical protein
MGHPHITVTRMQVVTVMMMVTGVTLMYAVQQDIA